MDNNIMHFTKGTRNFVVRFEKKEVFIGTMGYLGNIAAQMVCHEEMAPLKWKATGTCINLEDKDGNLCLAVGYKLPRFQRRQKSLQKLEALFQS